MFHDPSLLPSCINCTLLNSISCFQGRHRSVIDALGPESSSCDPSHYHRNLIMQGVSGIDAVCHIINKRLLNIIIGFDLRLLNIRYN